MICCLAISLLLLAACGGDDEPAAAPPPEEASAADVPAADAPAEPAPAADLPPNLAHLFSDGTSLVTADEGGPLRNPMLAVTGEGFRWGALVRRGGELMWVVDGQETPIEGGEVSEFVASRDLSRYAYVSNGVVVVDGKQVEQGTTSCCPTFSLDGSRFGYIADGSVGVIDGTPQESQGSTVEQLIFSPVGSSSAYVVGGNTVVLGGSAQKQYDSVSALTFSPDGSRFAYMANDQLLVVDGEESEIGESTAEQIAFSPDGSRVAYVRGDRKSGRVVLDDTEQKRHAFGCAEDLLPWACMTFSSDGSTLAYVTLLLSSVPDYSGTLAYRVVRDGNRETLTVACCLIASPEGAKIAYVSEAQGVVVDGRTLGSMELSGRTPDDLVFSMDGTRVAFLLHESEATPKSITSLFLETLDVP